MATINWYPGHMTKSIRMMKQEIASVDFCLYVLDARAPKSCLNPDFEVMTDGKPIIYILNKSDLVPDDKLTVWKKYLTGSDSRAVIMDYSKDGRKLLSPIISELCKAKLEKYRNKGVQTCLKGMVMGVPNCGKSTIINNLAGKARTLTGNKAGVTRGKQWVKVSDYLEVLDTPGTLYPKLSDQTIAKHLAYIGSIKDEVVEVIELSVDLIAELRNIAPESIKIRYNVEFSETDYETLEAIARKRGFLLKGGEVDILRTSNTLLDDFRKGKLGKIILEEI